MGIKTWRWICTILTVNISEKPPHHMGIKTSSSATKFNCAITLKNLPTTWGLRRRSGHWVQDPSAL